MRLIITKLVIVGLIFIICGELLIRIDEKFNLFQKSTDNGIEVRLESTEELERIQSGDYSTREDAYRILVLGDSYIYGGGVSPSEKFSQQLRDLFENDRSVNKPVHILDVSRPSNNSRDNALTYFQYAAQFEPDVVVVGYNANDIEGWLGTAKERDTFDTDQLFSQFPEYDFMNKNDAADDAKPVIKEKKSTPTTIERIYGILYKSKLLHSILHRTHKELNRQGYVIPFSRFGVLLTSYETKDGRFKASSDWIELISESSKKNSTDFVFYFLPEMNLLEKPELFSTASENMSASLLGNTHVTFVSGLNEFSGASSKDYQISKYDGHPNASAHREMALQVYRLLTPTKAK